MDWGDGEYERTARVLAPVSDEVVAAAGVRPGQVVLDVATGTGNCALAAARAGGAAIGVDPSDRLLDVARARALEEGHEVRFLPGEATRLPVENDVADVATSVFGVIFEPDGPAAVAELRRAVRPGGRVVITAWTAHGAVHQAGMLLREAVSEAFGGGGPAGTAWSDPQVLQGLFQDCEVVVEQRGLRFTADSPQAWFAEQEEHHPVWRQVRAAVPEPAWTRLRERSVGLLAEANEDPSALAVTSPYWLVTVTLPVT